MSKSEHKITDEECIDLVRSILIATIKDKKTPEKNRLAAGTDLLRLLSIKHKLTAGDDGKQHFFHKSA